MHLRNNLLLHKCLYKQSVGRFLQRSERRLGQVRKVQGGREGGQDRSGQEEEEEV